MNTLALSVMPLLLVADSLASPVQEEPRNARVSSSASANITREASRPAREGDAGRFTGHARVTPLFAASAPSRTSGAYVTFEPGARTAWHTHPLGQTLVVTAGSGYVQLWGGPVQDIGSGDVIWIPPGQKHWHGASTTSALTHLAIQEQLDGRTVAWMEQVSEAQHGGSDSRAAAPTAAAKSSRAQQLFGDIAPKLAQLTDDVLYADVWERPQLSKRDRSLVTVSALIALNRPDQLRSHLILARLNGVTQEELMEAITHLAFYAGWPSAVSAAAVAKEVFQGSQGPANPR